MALPWYPRNVGKYARKTKTLSMLQHGAYNLLLDHYYSTGPINAFEQCSSNAQLMPDHSSIYRLCIAITKQEQDTVDYILGKYFTLEKDGFYHNVEADEVIEIQSQKHETRVRVGKENRAKAMLKQCSSNAIQIKTKKKIKIRSDQEAAPSVDKSNPQGTKKNDLLKIGSGKGDEEFEIRDYLSPEDILEVRVVAPQWAIHELAEKYNAWIKGKEIPRNPAKAFTAWAKSFTKGKPP